MICASSGALKSHKSEPIYFAAGTKDLGKNGIAVPQSFLQMHQVPFHAVDIFLCRMESLFFLKQPYCSVFFSLEMNVKRFPKRQNKTRVPTDKKDNFQRPCLSDQFEYYEKIL